VLQLLAANAQAVDQESIHELYPLDGQEERLVAVAVREGWIVRDRETSSNQAVSAVELLDEEIDVEA